MGVDDDADDDGGGGDDEASCHPHLSDLSALCDPFGRLCEPCDQLCDDGYDVGVYVSLHLHI